VTRALGFGLVLGCLLPACADRASDSAPAAPPPVAVATFTVAPTTIEHTLASVGALQSPNSTEIRAEIAGKVVLIDIPEGQEVEAGYLLVKIDDAQARAAASVSRARFRNAEETLQRLRALRGSDIASQQALDDALAEQQASQGQLATAETALAKTEIRAPFRGVLGLRKVSLGAYLSPGSSVVRLTQVKPLHLVFGLPERHVAEVAVDQRVRGLVPTCETFEARVVAIDPEIAADSRVVQIKALVPNEDGSLLPGMSAAVQLTVGRIPDALMVPQEAVVHEGTKRLVYTVAADDTVAAKEVVLGELQTERVQVTGGLQAGDVVVATGQQRLRPGAKVVAQPYTAVDNPNLALGADGVAFGCPL
jgi:membrane fusion protein, multidrug efflux system